MGVTIHYQGALPDEAAYERFLETVETFAAKRRWPSWKIEEAEAHLIRESEEGPIEYVGPSRGVEFLPHSGADPLRFEFDLNLFVQEFCKTQFAGVATHVEIIDLLRAVSTHFDRLEVSDEGEFWETGDVDILAGHLNRIDEILAEMKRDDPTADGPIRLESGRFIDLMTGQRHAPRWLWGLKKLLKLPLR